MLRLAGGGAKRLGSAVVPCAIRQHEYGKDAYSDKRLSPEVTMHLTASDFASYYRPSPCELRVSLREKREHEAEPGVFDEVLQRLGLRHDIQHLATLGPYTDLSKMSFEDRLKGTREAIKRKAPLIYQPAFMVTHSVNGIAELPPAQLRWRR
jgi:hypothetical protein